jgi:hypothetical protein
MKVRKIARERLYTCEYVCELLGLFFSQRRAHPTREGALIKNTKILRTNFKDQKKVGSIEAAKVSCARFLVWCYPERRRRRVGATCNCVGKPSPSQNRKRKKIHKIDHQFANWTESSNHLIFFFFFSFREYI